MTPIECLSLPSVMASASTLPTSTVTLPFHTRGPSTRGTCVPYSSTATRREGWLSLAQDAPRLSGVIGACLRVVEHDRKVGLVLTGGAICIRLLGDRRDWAERALDANLLWFYRPLRTPLPLLALSGPRYTCAIAGNAIISLAVNQSARRLRRERCNWSEMGTRSSSQPC